MTEAEPERISGLHTKEERMGYWQMCRVLIDYKQKHLTRADAVTQFAYWAQVPPTVAIYIFSPMSKETLQHLRMAFPDWISEEDAPTFEDVSSTTTKKNALRRKEMRKEAQLNRRRIKRG